jgi:hypothetical protein
MAIDINTANNIQKSRSGEYALPFKDFKKNKKVEITASRAKIAEQRASASLESQSRIDNLKTESETVTNNTPEDQKGSGISKLKPSVDAQTKKIASLVIPNLVTLAIGYAGNNINLGNNIDLCPPEAITKSTLETLNNIVKFINSSAETTDKIAITATTAATIASTIQQISTGLATAIPVISTAAKTIPVIPGVVVSALDDLDYFNNLLLYKKDGTAKLPPIIAGVNAISLSIAMFSLNLKNAAAIVEAITLKLQKCLPSYDQNKIEQLSEISKQYVNYGVDDYNNFDRSTYQGFIIKIETVPYTPTVNRTRAVGYNSQGIPLIQTELSFTSNSQTLVSELKLIIDRDNLKAY